MGAFARCCAWLRTDGDSNSRRSAEYAWEKSEFQLSAFKNVTLLEEGTSRQVRQRELKQRMNQVLNDFRPEVVFIPGWSGKAAFAALRWCLCNNVPAVAMSESTAWDERRAWWKEWVKRKIVGLCAAALVGGRPHQEYMMKLGMPAGRIFLGYDAVDNRYFSAKTAESRKQKVESRNHESERTSPNVPPPSPQSGEGQFPENYFLASARFIEKKNLPRLIQAYAQYRDLAQKSEGRNPASVLCPPSSAHWSLVLLGDGPLKPDLRRLISDLRLDDCVHLPGFKQYPDLPAYYGLAKAFIHASTTEQWGLVVNEAMASGLPVLVSNRCGCATDLVQEGKNGFTFDPYNVEQLAQLMAKISVFQFFSLLALGDASRQIISNWGPERFAQGLKEAAEKAMEVGSKRAGWFDRLLLQGMLLR